MAIIILLCHVRGIISSTWMGRVAWTSVSLLDFTVVQWNPAKSRFSNSRIRISRGYRMDPDFFSSIKQLWLYTQRNQGALKFYKLRESKINKSYRFPGTLRNWHAGAEWSLARSRGCRDAWLRAAAPPSHPSRISAAAADQWPHSLHNTCLSGGEAR